MYFNLFTPFTVADLGRAGQRLVTSTGAAHTDSASLLARGLAIRLMWEEAVLWWKRWVRHWDNQLISLLSRSRHPYTITGMGTLCKAVWKSVSDPPLTESACLSSRAWPGHWVFIEMCRAPGACQTCHQLTCKKYNLRIHTFLNISNFQQSYFIQELFQFPCKIIDNWLESIEGIAIFDAVYRIQQKLRMFPRMLYLSPLRMIGGLYCRAWHSYNYSLRNRTQSQSQIPRAWDSHDQASRAVMKGIVWFSWLLFMASFVAGSETMGLTDTITKADTDNKPPSTQSSWWGRGNSGLAG